MDAWAEITFSDGRKRKQELYYGHTYLSQSDRVLIIPGDAVQIEVISFSGQKRRAADLNKIHF
jgi:hypothetical protein